MDTIFFLNGIFLGIGLSMDAFSISIANGLNEHCMRKTKMFCIAGTFGFFQALMPIIGWLCVHTIINYFSFFEKFIPWIALFLLAYIGIKMIIESQKKDKEDCIPTLTIKILFIQGIATSIDALSVGFTIADYKCFEAIITSILIAVVTFLISLIGLFFGKKLGTKLSNKAEIFGGIILIAIGIEIFIKGIL